ncbi:LOW QUALITY PROTEIN: putative E3 ubiquitin-protein ligase MARCHF10 [Morus bassanus]
MAAARPGRSSRGPRAASPPLLRPAAQRGPPPPLRPPCRLQVLPDLPRPGGGFAPRRAPPAPRWLPRERQKFISGAQYAREMPYKMDSESQVGQKAIEKTTAALLAEDEEEGDQCHIYQIAEGSPTNPLLEPCGCVGSLLFVHQECLKKRLKAKIKSGADLEAVKTCELCKQNLITDVDNFNMNAYYRNHQQSRAQHELTGSGLYLGPHHLYKQRFAELMRLSYILITRKRLFSPHRTSKVLPRRPSFSKTSQ